MSKNNIPIWEKQNLTIEEAAEYSAEYDRRFKRDSDERWPRQGHYMLKDYFALPDQIRVELIDGVIYDMTAPKPVHQDSLAQTNFDHYHRLSNYPGMQGQYHLFDHL